MRLLLLVLSLTIAWPAVAETTMAELLDLAWDRHPQARALEARRFEAEARREVADGLVPEPGALSVGAHNDGAGRNLGKQGVDAELSVPLWLPGQRLARQTLAQQERDAVEAEAAVLRLKLAGELREAWGTAQLARMSRELARRRLETAMALEADVVRRYRVGDVARVDANLASNERLIAEAALAEAQTATRASEQAWRTLTGQAPPQKIEDESIGLRAAAIESHPLLRLAAVNARTARARVKLAEHSQRDTPELALSLSRERDDTDAALNTIIGVKLRIPFAGSARNQQAAASASAESATADAEFALARARVELAVESARAEIEAARRQLEFAADRHRLTADNLQLTQRAFQLGELDLANLLRARATAFEAELNFNQQSHAQALAQARLKQAQGDLP